MIDSHQHFWKYDSEKYSWISEEMSAIRKDFMPEDLKPVLRKNKFNGCIVVQADQSEAETEKLLEMAEQNDFIKGVVGWVDLCSPDVEERLEHFMSSKYLKGLRHTVWDEKGEFMKDRDFRHGIGLLANMGLTYDILAFDYQLASAVELVREFPRQKFVLDHMGKPNINGEPDKAWVKNIIDLGDEPNVWCKISGLATEAPDFNWKTTNFEPYLDTVVKAFGVDRLLFGSDWPVCLAAASYEEVVEIIENYFSSFSKEERVGIFGRNASEFYNLNIH